MILFLNLLKIKPVPFTPLLKQHATKNWDTRTSYTLFFTSSSKGPVTRAKTHQIQGYLLSAKLSRRAFITAFEVVNAHTYYSCINPLDLN